jgi:hypothetical protein
MLASAQRLRYNAKALRTAFAENAIAYPTPPHFRRKEARVTLELSKLSGQVQAMGQEMAVREKEHAERVAQAQRWLTEYAEQAQQLGEIIRDSSYSAAIPTDEPVDAQYDLPPVPERFTFIAADGAEIQPDSHGVAFYYLINVGALVYRHGSGETPEAYSLPTIGYSEDDVYEQGQPVTGNLLDTKRDIAELTCLADLCTSEIPDAITVAVVDGTLILWTLQDTPQAYQAQKAQAYLQQLDRIRKAGAAVAACISRPRRSEVAKLLYLAYVGGDVDKVNTDPRDPMERVPDHAVFETLSPGVRSALFVSPSKTNERYYRPHGHTVHFFYLNLAEEERRPAIVRVEVPAWIADSADDLALVHCSIVVQARIAGDYPYALIRADELAFISNKERQAFEDMITGSLVRAGVPAALSPKKYYKTLTRRGKRKFR